MFLKAPAICSAFVFSMQSDFLTLSSSLSFWNIAGLRNPPLEHIGRSRGQKR